VHPSGVEPESSANKHEQIVLHGHKNGHKDYVAHDSDLQKVITVWPSLAAPLKTAILAIVGSVTASPEVKP
jgi:hypothetical protein